MTSTKVVFTTLQSQNREALLDIKDEGPIPIQTCKNQSIRAERGGEIKTKPNYRALCYITLRSVCCRNRHKATCEVFSDHHFFLWVNVCIFSIFCQKALTTWCHCQKGDKFWYFNPFDQIASFSFFTSSNVGSNSPSHVDGALTGMKSSGILLHHMKVH